VNRILFFDIDGTLIAEHQHIVPESAVEAIKEAQKKGHICVVNTGRSDALVKDWLQKQVPFDGYLLGCGTRITYKGEVLLQQTLTKDQARLVIDMLKKHHIDAILEGTENCYHGAVEEMSHPQFQEYAKHFVGMGFGTLEESVGKFDKFYCFAGERSVIDAFLQDIGDIMWAIDRGAGYYEVVPKGFSKASGMKFLADYLKMSMEQTVAIGDSNNDRAMMECAGFSIAMGNAVDAIKEMADFVTTDVKEDGIKNALALF